MTYWLNWKCDSPKPARTTRLENPGFETRRQRQAEFAALGQPRLVELAGEQQRRLHLSDVEPLQDSLHAVDGTPAVVARPHEQRIRLAVDLVDAIVEYAIQKQLHSAAHVAEILGRTQDEAVAPQEILGRRRQRIADPNLGIDVRVTGAGNDLVRHFRRGTGLAVVHNE